jgi:hypothetical protein
VRKKSNCAADKGRLHPGEQGGASFLQGQRGGVLAIVEGLDDDSARKVDHAELMDAPSA